MKVFLVAALGLLVAVLLSATVYITYRFNVGSWEHDGKMSRFYPGIDFLLRTNEAKCLMSGVDPFKVWHQEVKLAPYYPFDAPALCRDGWNEPICAYTPWGYAMAIPMAVIPRRVMWPIYFCSMLACLLVLSRWAYQCGGRGLSGAIVALLSLLGVGYPVFTNICVANYSLHIMLALLLMIVCLNRGWDVLAGVFWSFAMIKPNLAMLVAIPLLMRRKWRTCCVATGVCVALSIPAMVLSGSSFIELLGAAPATAVDIFAGCGTFPYCFRGVLPVSSGIKIGLVVGGLVCLLLTWVMRNEKDWKDLLVPAIVCGMCWSHARTHVHALGWFLFVAVFAELVLDPKSRSLWTIAIASLFFASRVYRCLYGVVTIYGDYVLGAFRHSEELHRTLDSLNSTCVLLVCMAFCLWKKRRSAYS